MKSILVVTDETHTSCLEELSLKESNDQWSYFEANGFKEAYDWSAKRELDIVIINQGFEDIEEQELVMYLNHKNPSTVFIPYQKSSAKRIKKRIVYTLEASGDL